MKTRRPRFRLLFNPLALAVLMILNLATHALGERITVDASRTFQRIEGFGTCLISWGNFPGRTYTPSFVEWYREEVGLNMVREALDGFDHPEVEDPADISWRNIQPNSRAAIFERFSKRLKEVDPDALIIGTVWTPPSWMKVNKDSGNGTGNGGRNFAIRAHSYDTNNRGASDNRVHPDKFEHFVAWLVAVVEYHRNEGIPLYAVSPANEPRFSQWYGSCIWTAEDLATIIAMLGDELERRGLGDTLIFGPEDMTGHFYDGGTRTMVEAIVLNRDALRHLDRFATHGYTDGVQMDASEDSSRLFWELIEDYGKPYWMTEGGTGGHDWPEPIQKGVAMALHNSLVAGNASAFVPWQISESRPSTHGLAVNDDPTPKTFAAMQYFRTIPLGAHRIEATPAFGDVQASAFHHRESGETAIILINTTPEPTTVELELRGLDGLSTLEARRTSEDEGFEPVGMVRAIHRAAEVRLPPLSITSLTGRAEASASAGPPRAPAIEPAREWTDEQGRSITAALVAYDGEVVVLRIRDQDYTLPISRLSEADQQYLAENHGK